MSKLRPLERITVWAILLLVAMCLVCCMIGCKFRTVGLLQQYSPPDEQELALRDDLKEFMANGGTINTYGGATFITTSSGNTRYIAPRR